MCLHKCIKREYTYICISYSNKIYITCVCWQANPWSNFPMNSNHKTLSWCPPKSIYHVTKLRGKTLLANPCLIIRDWDMTDRKKQHVKEQQQYQLDIHSVICWGTDVIVLQTVLPPNPCYRHVMRPPTYDSTRFRVNSKHQDLIPCAHWKTRYDDIQSR